MHCIYFACFGNAYAHVNSSSKCTVFFEVFVLQAFKFLYSKPFHQLTLEVLVHKVYYTFKCILKLLIIWS